MKLFRQSATAVTNVASYMCTENMVQINRCKVGTSQCPSEIISVSLKDGWVVKAHVFYDMGSQHSLANRAVHPLVVSKRTSGHPIQLTTVAGANTSNRQIVLVKMGHDVEIEAILVNDLNILNYNMTLPAAWNKFKANWCDAMTQWMPRSS